MKTKIVSFIKNSIILQNNENKHGVFINDNSVDQNNGLIGPYYKNSTLLHTKIKTSHTKKKKTAVIGSTTLELLLIISCHIYYVICDLWNEPIGSLMIGLNNIDDCGIKRRIHLKKQKIIIWNGFDAMRRERERGGGGGDCTPVHGMHISGKSPKGHDHGLMTFFLHITHIYIYNINIPSNTKHVYLLTTSMQSYQATDFCCLSLCMHLEIHL
ncbi:hypothetical protein ACJX0J_038198, partial [Zea mays]